MTPRALQRSGLPLFIIAAVVFAAAVAVLFLVANPFADGGFLDQVRGDRTSFRTGESAPEPGPAPAAEPETQPEPEQEPAPSVGQPPDNARNNARDTAPSPAARHTVVRGDTLFDLAGSYWSDPYLWPLILVANADSVSDPDFLRQGSVLDIPPSPLRGGVLPASAVPAVTDAHILAHERYRDLGRQSLAAGRETGNPWAVQQGLIRINKSRWVLYSGLRYDDELPQRAAGRVSADDLEILRGFIRVYGPRPGGR
jgi:hypothetical protein